MTGNEEAARRFAAALPHGYVSVSPTPMVGAFPVLDGWSVSYSSSDPQMWVSGVFFGAGQARIAVEFGGRADDASVLAQDAVLAVMGGADVG